MTGADRVKVTPQGQSLTTYGVGSDKSVSDLIDAGVSIKWDGTTGKVQGTIKNIKEAWTGYSSTGDNTGHFFPVELDEKYKDDKITVIGAKQRSAKDRFWVLRVENAKDGAKGTFTFKKASEELFTLDFSEATLEE